MLAAPPLVAPSNTTWLVGAGLSLPAGVFDADADNGWDITPGWEHRVGKQNGRLTVR